MTETDHDNDERQQIDYAELIRTIGETFPTLLNDIRDIVDKLASSTDDNQIVVKRRQYGNYAIILLIVFSVSILAFFGSIDGSAAAGILGAAVGHIFTRSDNK